ncbi:MAG: GNAT family N-acetyltransferase [Candidatus Hodarchaeales archaeon]|jgi:GNAT superfamily N-acetyltransferase
MVHKIPQDKLREYLPFFSEHSFFRASLNAIPVWHMGAGFVDDLERPEVILFSIGDETMGEYFLAGNYESPKINEFLAHIPEKRPIFVPSQEWVPVLKDYWDFFGFVPRTDFSADDLTIEHVDQLLAPLPEGFEIQEIDLEIAKQLEYFHKIYPGGPEGFFKDGGLAFCIRKDEELVSRISATSTFSYEIDITTEPEYRGKGFATIISARFLKYCLEHGIKPHWDAANKISAELALKLGFTNPQRYKYYYWRSKPLTASDLKANVEPQYNKALQDSENFKTELEGFITKKQLPKAKAFLHSGSTKIIGVLERIASDTNRFIETDLVKKSDEPHFREFVEKVHQHMEELNQYKRAREMEIGT